jgi:CheY-like chemotaxis protein
VQKPSHGAEGLAVSQRAANAADYLVILIIEDDALVREMIAQYLRDGDCTVLEADSAEQAAAICRSGQEVHVLVTDINLNGPASGWGVAEEFRAARPGVGVVYVSGNSTDRRRCVPDRLFFHKPYLCPDILQACQFLANRPSSAKSVFGEYRPNSQRA